MKPGTSDGNKKGAVKKKKRSAGTAGVFFRFVGHFSPASAGFFTTFGVHNIQVGEVTGEKQSPSATHVFPPNSTKPRLHVRDYSPRVACWGEENAVFELTTL